MIFFSANLALQVRFTNLSTSGSFVEPHACAVKCRPPRLFQQGKGLFWKIRNSVVWRGLVQWVGCSPPKPWSKERKKVQGWQYVGPPKVNTHRTYHDSQCCIKWIWMVKDLSSFTIVGNLFFIQKLHLKWFSLTKYFYWTEALSQPLRTPLFSCVRVTGLALENFVSTFHSMYVHIHT